MNGFVNKQNGHICREENAGIILEKVVYLQKCTVLWYFETGESMGPFLINVQK